MKKVSDVMKKLILGVFCICMLVGCGSKDAYERDESAGKIVTITLDEMRKSFRIKKPFLLYLQQAIVVIAVSFMRYLKNI